MWVPRRKDVLASCWRAQSTLLPTADSVPLLLWTKSFPIFQPGFAAPTSWLLRGPFVVICCRACCCHSVLCRCRQHTRLEASSSHSLLHIFLGCEETLSAGLVVSVAQGLEVLICSFRVCFVWAFREIESPCRGLWLCLPPMLSGRCQQMPDPPGHIRSSLWSCQVARSVPNQHQKVDLEGKRCYLLAPDGRTPGCGGGGQESVTFPLSVSQ